MRGTGGSNGGAALRVVLADAHGLVRVGLRAVLERRGIDVVGEAATGEELVASFGELAPDVVLCDLTLGGMPGLEAIRRLTALEPGANIVALGAVAGSAEVVAAAHAGVRGYLLKEASPEEIVRAVEVAASGEALLSPPAAAALLEHVRGEPVPAERPVHEADLSEREVDVLRLLARGKDNVEIAELLEISPRTVKNHVSRIFAKLGVSNRTAAGLYAIRSGHLAEPRARQP